MKKILKKEAEKSEKIAFQENEYILENKRIRKEFAKVFNWIEPYDPYRSSSYTEFILPSWEKIFVEVGKLLEKRDCKDLSDQITKIEDNTFEILKNDRNKSI